MLHTKANFIDVEAPTLRKLLCFPLSDRKLNVVKEIGVHYMKLGIFLLEDDNGEQTSAIEQEFNRDAERINIKLLQKWLSGTGRKPVTWSTLITVLQDMELHTLASNIEQHI